jgi:hypothetical protein
MPGRAASSSCLVLLLLLFTASSLHAQEHTISGTIRDRNTKEALPFVSIGFKGSGTGTTTDFEGNFSLRIPAGGDSLVVTYIGYRRYTQRVNGDRDQVVAIELQEQAHMMNEVVVRPRENPALRIIDKARANRDRNSQANLDAYEYNSYSKTEISLNRISEAMKNRRVFKPLKTLFDTAHQLKDEDGRYMIPVFISETYSEFYYLKEPSHHKEFVKASSITGIGVTDKSYLADFLGSTLQDYNFNSNYIRLFNKDFISPLANIAHSYYIYTLLDSSYVSGVKCFKIQLNLRNERDLAFEGVIWITDSDFALKRVDVETNRHVNMNFIDRIRVQQELVKTAAGPWIVNKNRLLLDVAEVTKNSTGLIAKFYNSYTGIVVNKPHPAWFYADVVDRSPVSEERNDTFWQHHRPEALSPVEKAMFHMVDSVKKLPVIQTYVDVVRIIVEGYKRIGPVDVGPYVFLYGHDAVEGSRFRLGFRTNHQFNARLQLKAYLAYGVRDNRYKYSYGAEYILDKRKYSTIGASYRDDYDIIGVTDVQGATNSSNLFQAFNIASSHLHMNHTIDYNIDYTKMLSRDWTVKLNLRNNVFEPLGNFVFEYKLNPEAPATQQRVSSSYINSSATIEARWAYKELLVERSHKRVRLKKAKLPVVIAAYTHGFKDVLNSSFDYDKVSLSFAQHINTSFLGNADYWLSFGKIFGVLPYPMLNVARGNRSFIYSDLNYSLMNFYEFVSDQYLHFTYVQHFEGLLFNRIPWLKKFNLRNFAFVKCAYGSLSAANQDLIPVTTTDGRPVFRVHSFGTEPYVEAGYGIENIFRLFSVGMVHRLNYLNLPFARPWGVNVGVRFQL